MTCLLAAVVRCSWTWANGTGKSLTALAIAGRLYLDGNIGKLLIVAPTSVCTSWPSEFQKFAGYPTRVGLLLGDRDKRLGELKRLTQPTPPGLVPPLSVAIINYESTWRLEQELIDYGADMIICDESQRIKSATAKQSKTMHKLGARARYRLMLTGTPVQNNTLDLWSQYQFLAPGTFHSSYYAFQRHYAVMGGVGNHQYFGPRNTEELTAKLHAIDYRVTKAECLDLPEKVFETRVVALEPKAQRLYDKLRKESYAELENGAEVSTQLVITKLLRLQQLTGGFLSDDDGNINNVSTAKLDALEDIIESLCVDAGQKIIVFARFLPELKAIRERVQTVLDRAGQLKHVAIWGEVPAAERGKLVTQFQEDPDTRVFVGQIEACAEGLTLTAAYAIVYYSVTWNYAKWQQSQDRIHRIGQTQTCVYLNLTAPGTIDEKIMDALHRKEDIASRVVDNWRNLL